MESKKMAKKLKDIEITHISLVKAGANNKTFIYKSIATEPTYDRVVNIVKQDNEKGIVYGIVYEPDTVDAQGDFTTSEEIQKASYNFMK
jgi:ABC-type molybdate transport system substrate-binding protein